MDSGHRADHPERREHVAPCTQRAARQEALRGQADAPALVSGPEWAHGPGLASVQVDQAERRDLCRLRAKHHVRSGQEPMRDGDASSIPRLKKAQ